MRDPGAGEARPDMKNHCNSGLRTLTRAWSLQAAARLATPKLAVVIERPRVRTVSKHRSGRRIVPVTGP